MYIKPIFGLTLLAILPLSAAAGPFTNAMKLACPDKWAITDQAIPVVTWLDEPPWGLPNGTVDDKTQVISHIAKVKPLATISGEAITLFSQEIEVPPTTEELANDPLTVASECLVYRNYEVNTWNYVAPAPPTPNPATGWIPSVIY